MKLFLQNWAVIAPGVWGQDGVDKLSAIPAQDYEDIPFQLDFVKPAQRRRLTYTTKLALQVAFLVASKETLSNIPTIFVTRHGELANAVKVLNDIKINNIPSPTQFIHSVHGTAAGIFSIVMNNRQASQTLANGEEELTPAIFEIASILSACDATELLVVFFDAPVVGYYKDYVDKPDFPYGVALHFHKTYGNITLELDALGKEIQQSSLPQSLSFISWLQSDSTCFPLMNQGGWQILKNKPW